MLVSREREGGRNLFKNVILFAYHLAIVAVASIDGSVASAHLSIPPEEINFYLRVLARALVRGTRGSPLPPRTRIPEVIEVEAY